MCAKKVKNIRVARTHNANTMTEAQFFGWIRSHFRKMTMYWKPVGIAKNMNRKPVFGKRHKFEYQCAQCKNWHPEKNIDIDHIEEAGSLKSFDDLPGFARRLFCDVDGLQILCKPCHKEKTHKK